MLKRMNLIAYAFFILSGACGLVYEVTWARYLALFLGHTTLAHMCVLAAFMGGLALGSILIGRMTVSFRRPLAVYGVLELVIGLYAVLSPAIINSARSVVLHAGSDMQLGSPSWLGLKLLVSITVLLLPTFLMGGTFPILMRHFQPESASSEDKSEWLYLVNCVGAVAGSLLAGFALIPSHGMHGTLAGTGLANAVLGVAAIGLGMLSVQGAATKSRPDDSRRSGAHPLVLPVCVAVGISGLASMVYELVWIRIFAVTLGSSTYSFTLMLSAFITGISLGSLAVGLVPALRRKPLVSLAFVEIAVGLTVLLTMPTYERLPYVFWKWAALLNRTPETYGLFNMLKYSLCFVVMVVPTFFCGMALPLAIKSVARHDERIGKDSGLVYGANTAGTLVGALLAGLVLIRVLGLRHSLELAILINVAAGVLILLVCGMPRGRAVALVSCLVVVGLALVMPKWHPLSFVVGTFRYYSNAPASWEQYVEHYGNMDVHFYREDHDGTVAVATVPATGDVSLFINGKADASSHGDLCTQVLLGQLPMFLKPDARDVLVVGLGSGVSAGSVLTHPDAQVDCVEISPAVVEAARCFDDVNWLALENDRLNLIQEDARTYVSVTRRKYDIVSSEPSNPWIAGIGNLFSEEYYQGVDKVLKPGGILTQWVQRYEISDDLVRTVLRTVQTVFPHVYLFEASPADYIIIASREPLTPDYGAMQRSLRQPAVGQDLKRISVDSIEALLGRQVLAPENARAMAGTDGPTNSDDRPLLEFQAPRSQFLVEQCHEFTGADQRVTRGKSLLVAQYLGGKPLSRQSTESLISSYADPRVGQSRLIFPLVNYYLSKWEDNPEAYRLYASLAKEMDNSGARNAAMAIPGDPSDPETLEVKAQMLTNDLIGRHSVFTPQDFRPALSVLDKALAAKPDNQGLQGLKRQVEYLTR